MDAEDDRASELEVEDGTGGRAAVPTDVDPMPVDDEPTTDVGGPGEDDGAGDDVAAGTDRSELSRRLAAGAFAVYLAVAAVLLVRFGDGLWFASDDWGFLDGRNLWSFNDVMRAQNGHWVALPVVVFQVLYRLFGLSSYVPFLLATVTMHLTLCVLIRVVMRRAGVGPWIATIFAGSFVLFGAGFENLLYALQITLVGSMVFGFAQLLLADHDGKLGRRDALAVACGLLGLLCSSVGVAMVVVVGLAVLIRRGWRMALVQTAPLGVVFLAWYRWQQSQGYLEGSGELTMSPSAIGEWLWDLLSATFTSIGGYGFVAAAIVAMLVVGGALAITDRGWPGARRTLAVPLALLGGSLVLVAYIGSQRATLMQVFPSIAVSPRYQAMVAAMVLPAIAIAGSELIRRWRFTAPVVVALLLIGIPANIRVFDSAMLHEAKASSENQKRFLTAVAASPVAKQVDEDVHPNPNEFGPANVTVGFLRHALKEGKLPQVEPPGKIVDELINVRLRLAQSLAEDPVPAATCRDEESVVVDAKKGDRFVLGSAARIAIADDDGTFRPAMPFDISFAGRTLTSQFDQTFQVNPIKGAKTVSWCTVD